MAVSLNALAPTTDINTMVQLANNTKNLVNPEVFYSKQLLDTIRMGADQYKYYKLADVSPIQNKADKLTVRRWAPLQAHTVPLDEGIPPKSDKGSVEKYEMEAHQYGRYMEFTDKVDFNVVDPVIAHYSSEYSIVAIETLDLLAREELFSKAQKYYAGMGRKIEGTNLFEQLTVDDSKPNMTDLRLIVLSLKRQLVKPRANGRYKVICSPEFTYDMIEDPTVEKFMKINQTTKDAYDGSVLFPLFGMDFEETLVCPADGSFKKVIDSAVKKCKRLYREAVSGDSEYVAGETHYVYATVTEDTYTDAHAASGDKIYSKTSGYVKDSRTHQDASYIPDLETWDIEHYVHTDESTGWSEMNVHHILIVGKDALTRTGLTGEGNARMYTKPKGSAGVLDPIDQRQSIGFKINSVGFGSTRMEAIVDYMCVPAAANLI
jgi:hypothetical protein